MSSLAARLGSREAGTPVAALDIGTSKVSCMIASAKDIERGMIQISGAGSQSGNGVNGSGVVSMEVLERTIRLAVQQAEQAASLQVDNVVIGISGPDLRCDVLNAAMPLNGQEITSRHISNIIAAALADFSEPGREILHVTPMGFVVDNCPGVRDPKGMCADRLSVALLAASVPSPALHNLTQCVSNAHLNPVSIVAAPFASGLACLVPDELEGGTVVLDLGAGATGAAAFRDGGLIWLGAIPVGGAHVSADLAQGLGTTFAAADRLKTLNGSASLARLDAFDMLDAPRLGADGKLEAATISRGELTAMLRPRIEEIFEMIGHKMAEAETARNKALPSRIVLTGGASAMSGVKDVAEDVFCRPVRLAHSLRTKGTGELYESPSFTALSGLLCYYLGTVGTDRVETPLPNAGLIRKAVRWLQNNF